MPYVTMPLQQLQRLLRGQAPVMFFTLQSYDVHSTHAGGGSAFCIAEWEVVAAVSVVCAVVV